MLCKCVECGEYREVTDPRPKHIRGETRCRKCFAKSRVKHYYRTCIECGDVKEVPSVKASKAQYCKACSLKRIGKVMAENNRIHPLGFKKRYTVTCGECGLTRSVTNNPKYRKTDLCSACAKVYSGKTRSKNAIERNKNMEYWRVCPDCEPEVATVKVSSKKNSGIKYCRKHKKVPTGKDRKQVSSYKPRKTNGVSKEAIERARRINQEHREAIKKEAKQIPKQKISDDDMVAMFLRNNKPSVIDNVTEIPHMISGKGLCPEDLRSII